MIKLNRLKYSYISLRGFILSGILCVFETTYSDEEKLDFIRCLQRKLLMKNQLIFAQDAFTQPNFYTIIIM